MLSLVISSLLFATYTAAQAIGPSAEVDKPQIGIEGNQFVVRLPRDSDAKFARTRLETDETSLFELETRIFNLEKLTTDDALTARIANSQNGAIGAAVSGAVNASTAVFTAAFAPSVQRVDDLVKDLVDFKTDTDNRLKAVEKTVGEQTDKVEKLDTRLTNVEKDLTKEIEDVSGDVTELTTTVSTNKKDVDTKIASAVAASDKKWCFSWIDGWSERSTSWRTVSNKACSIQSKSGWVKLNIEGRVYGHNHGGLRIIGSDGSIYGKHGTYGFQWMAHQWYWVTFNIVRYIKITSNKKIDFRIQARVNGGGQYSNYHGGSYEQGYSGLWIGMEEMSEPLSSGK
eukprot:m.336242 g.336242  ORF g.336242 m.336242 type:complete len:342 (-) comp17792_c0_seq1:128-1153(-)